jgi:lysophospholipase L1-like esterase
MTVKKHSKKATAWYWAIAISLPLVFLGGLEGILRISDYGNDYPLFIENPANPNYLLPRPDIVKRYFAANAEIPSVTMEANFLLADKPQNGFRLFVQGGSTAAGFPYGLGASIAGMLDKRLKATLPEHNVEVVNTALAAVNSFTVLDLTDEIVAQQPDAVLLYLGHNEYLGILGVGSNYTAANSYASTLLFLKLRSLRLFQLLQNCYASLQGHSTAFATEQNNSRTFMAKVAKHKDIPLNSDLYKAGLEQFSDNLKLILDKYQKAAIPVYLATIASNLLDQKPFSSEAIESEVDLSLQKIKAAIALADQLQAINLANQLAAYIDKSDNALAHYELGRLYVQLNQASGAKQQLELARDLDRLRFRAPSELNAIIRSTAEKYDSVILVDAEQHLSQFSPMGLIGNNLMLEHLHPNVRGYFLLADSFYIALKQQLKLTDWQSVSIEQAWAERPLLPAEEYTGFAKVLQLMNDYPFVEPNQDGNEKALNLPPVTDWQLALGKDVFLKKIDWLSMMKECLTRYQADNNKEMTLKTAVILAEALPHDSQINQYVAQLYTQQNSASLANYYTQRSALAKAR